MHSIHFRRLLNVKSLIIIGVVSLLITFLLLILSEDLHLAGKATHHKKTAPNRLRKSEDDKKMFHWMNEDEGQINMVSNDTKQHQRAEDQGHVLFFKDTRPPLTVPRVAKYCNPPYSQDIGKEGLMPRGYKLLNVHVLIRHGDRSPISRLARSYGSLNCLVDTTQHAHLSKVTNFIHEMAAASHKIPKDVRFSRWALYPSHTKCFDGQLTGVGAIQHILYGIHYSQRYIHQHQLFDETNWHDKVVAHTTEVSRTFQSAIAFLYGLLPNFDLEKLNLKGSNNIHFCEENIFGTACACAGIDTLRNKAGRQCRLSQGYAEIMKSYQGVLDYMKVVLDVSAEEISFPAAVMDGLSGYACHSLPPPCNKQGRCITAKVLESVWEPIDYQSNCLNKNENYRQYSKAYMLGLLHRIAYVMNSARNNQSIPAFHLYSGHDTTVSPLITALELEDGVWPGYASRITFELYQHIGTGDHFIRVLQNGRDVTSEVVFCRNKTEADLCRFSHFYNYVEAHNPQDFCRSLRVNSTLHHNLY